MTRSDPYYRNNAVAAAHLQMAGHPAHTEGWGGGTEGISIPLSSGHHLEIGQSPDYRNAGWQFRVVKHHEDPTYEQEGIKLGRTQMNRLVSPGPEKKQPRDDEYNSTVTAHPRDLPGHVEDFLAHPQVRAAIKANPTTPRIPKTRGPLGGQFG